MTPEIEKKLFIGVGRRCITPPKPVDIYSFEGKRRTSTRVLDDIFANVVCLSHADREILIVSLDIIWVPRELADEVRDWVVEVRGGTPADVLVCATHAHATPQLKNDFFNSARPDKEYAGFLLCRIKEAVAEAWNNLEEGYFEFGAGITQMTVHRRKRIPDLNALKHGKWRTTIANRPHFSKLCDDQLSVLWLRSAAGRFMGAVLNLACHPSLFRGDALSADFPGRFGGMLIKQYGPKFVPCFLQGFSGNVKARLTARNRAPLTKPLALLYYVLLDRYGFRKNLDSQDLDAFAGALIDRMKRVPERKRLVPALSSWEREVSLPHEMIPARAKFETMACGNDPLFAAYGRAMLERGAKESNLRIQGLTLSEDLIVVAMEGEIFCEYAQWLRRLLGVKGIKAMPVGCAGGMLGYIPDATAIAEGGYEVERCLMESGLPARFSPKIENLIKEAVLPLLGKKRN